MDEEIDYVKKMDSHASSLQKHTSRSKARKTVEAWQEKRPKQSKKNSRSIARKTTEAKQEKRVRLRSRISIFKCLATKSVSNSPTNFNVPKKNNKHAALRESGIYETVLIFWCYLWISGISRLFFHIQSI